MEHALRQYLSDHWAGSQAGVQVARRLLRNSPHGSFAVFMARLVDELEQDRAVLAQVMGVFNATALFKTAAAWLGERASVAADLASRTLGRSPALNQVMQVEALMMGTQGRLGLWQTLAELKATEPRLHRFDFAALVDRTTAHRAELERHRLFLAEAAFAEVEVRPEDVAQAHKA